MRMAAIRDAGGAPATTARCGRDGPDSSRAAGGRAPGAADAPCARPAAPPARRAGSRQDLC